jgi:hypothetical protein
MQLPFLLALNAPLARYTLESRGISGSLDLPVIMQTQEQSPVELPGLFRKDFEREKW